MSASQIKGEQTMSHRYIVSSTPYLKQSGRPIYKVPSRGNLPNPYNWKPGPVQNLIQIREESKDMVNVIITPPQEDTVDVESTQEREVSIIITPIQDVEPVKTRKIRGKNGKVQIVPIGNTDTITIL